MINTYVIEKIARQRIDEMYAEALRERRALVMVRLNHFELSSPEEAEKLEAEIALSVSAHGVSR